MSDRSSRTNRHGIPILGTPPKRCVWPQCIRGSAVEVNSQLPLCYDHAYQVWHIMDADNHRMQELIRSRQPQPEPTTKRQPSREPVIYYAKVGGSHIKIGWTTRLEQRMRSYPPNTELLAVQPGERADEQKLHKKFAVHRSHGNEWYPLAPVILDHIARVVAEHGEPPKVAFGAQPVKTPMPHRTREYIGGKIGPGATVVHSKPWLT